MPYRYEEQRSYVFTVQGQKDLARMMPQVKHLLQTRAEFKIFEPFTEFGAYDSWQAMALVDYLVELGFIREVPQGQVMGQDRKFTRGAVRL